MLLDFSKEFPKYDVMEELGLDPLDLGNLDLLKPKLRQMLREHNFPEKLVEEFNEE